MSASRLVNPFRTQLYPNIVIYLLLPIAIRVVLYSLLRSSGYFYGIPWDTFSRTHLSWQWAQHPYFAPSDVYWVPLQFWIVGFAYRLARPWLETSSILVPVFVNNMFLIGSMVITYLTSLRLGNRPAALLALLLASLFAGDVFVSYSGLSEPILIFFILLVVMSLPYQLRPRRRNGHAT